MKFLRDLTVVVLSLVVVSPSIALAVYDTGPEASLFSPKPLIQEGAVNCFDYYHFGSVQVDVSPVSSPITAGQTATFKGKIKNSNAYPIVDGQVYVKIFKKDQTNESLLRMNGYPIVDFFMVKDGISVAGNAEQDIAFDWTVPKGANGEYQAVFFFTSAHRYNLLGLSFTDDVVGNKANFSIVGTSTDLPVIFDKNSLMLNKNAYHPVTFLQHFTKDESVTVSATLKNESAKEKTVEVTWMTSKWDGILASNEGKREAISITLKPKESKKITYTPPTLPTSVTFVQSEVKDGDAKSLIYVRFVRDGYEDIRTNFPGIMSYPLVQGKETTIFSCVHATNSPVVEGGSLTLTLKDQEGNVLHTYTYTGGITGAMMGVKDTFVPTQNLATFSLTAKLERAGSVVEEVTMQYDCNAIDKKFCPGTRQSVFSNILPHIGGTTPVAVTGGIVAVLLLIGGGTWFYRRKKSTQNYIDGSTQSP